MKNSLDNLSIIILNYNSAELCISLVKELIELETGAHLFVVDNCSSDNSKIVLSEQLPQNNKVHTIFLDSNNGYAKGNNAGIRESFRINPDTDSILVMNPDIVVDNRDILFRLYNAIHENTNIGAITTQTIFNGQIHDPNECAWRFLTKSYMMFGGTLVGRLFVKDLKYPQLIPDSNGIATVDVVQGCFFMIRREVFEKIGMLDTHTFLYSEESMLAKKLNKYGYKNAVLTDLYIHHNHKVKDKKLERAENKIFDMKCFYDSRKYYIKQYSDCGKIFIFLSNIILDTDHFLKVVFLRFKTFLPWRNK